MPRKAQQIDIAREKLEVEGPGKLTDAELFALVLGSDAKQVRVLDTSKKILRQFRGIQIASANFNELRNVDGVGREKAYQIVAGFELARRLLKERKTTVIISPREVWEELKNVRDNQREVFVLYFLNSENELQAVQKKMISVGSLNASLIQPREVFEPAIKNSATQILIAHNDPSGSLIPSAQDLAVTKRLVEAGKLLGIEVLDHVIVTAEGYSSFKEKGLL